MDKRYNYWTLACIILFNLFFTASLLGEGFPNGGDAVGHYDLVVNTMDVLSIFFSTGELRLWNQDYYFGFPLFFFYAPLPYVFLAGLSFITTINALFLLKLSIVLFFSFFPLVIYMAARLMELEEKWALCIAFFSTSLSSATVFGLEYYAFFATGLFSQLWATVLFPIAFAFSYRYFVLKKGNPFYSVFFFYLTFISHLFVGLIAGMSIGLLFLLSFFFQKERKQLLLNGSILFLFFFLSISFFVIPYFFNQDYFGNISFDLQRKEQGFGFVQTMSLLLEGELLDYSFSFSRVPVLTLLFFFGTMVSFFWKEFREKYNPLSLFLFIAFVFSITAVAGKTSFSIFDKLPVLSTLQTFRFIFLFHFVALFYIGIALWWFWALLERWKHMNLFFVLLFLFAAPVFYERMQTFKEYSIIHDLSAEPAYWRVVTAIKESPLNKRIYIPPSTDLLNHPQQLQALPLLTGNPIFISASIGAHDSFSAYYAKLPLSYDLADLFAVDFLIEGRDNNITLSTTKEPASYFSVVSVPFAVNAPARDARELIIAWLFSNASLAGHYMEIETLEKPIVFTAIKNNKNFIALVETGTDFAHSISGHIYFDKAPTMIVQLQNASFEISSYNYFQEYTSLHPMRTCGKVQQEQYARGYYNATVSVLEEDCFVLFKMSYHPEWKVFVDDNEEQLRMLSPSFMGVAVPLGTHEIIFSYEIFWWRIMLGILGIVSLLGLYFYPYTSSTSSP